MLDNSYMRNLDSIGMSHAYYVFSKPKTIFPHLINVVTLLPVACKAWRAGAAAEERLAVDVAALDARVARVGVARVHVGTGASVPRLAHGARTAPVAINHVDAAHTWEIKGGRVRKVSLDNGLRVLLHHEMNLKVRNIFFFSHLLFSRAYPQLL